MAAGLETIPQQQSPRDVLFDFVEQTSKFSRSILEFMAWMEAVLSPEECLAIVGCFEEDKRANTAAITRFMLANGGIAVSYKDEISGRHTNTTMFYCQDYDSVNDEWKMIASDSGQPPVPGSPYQDITISTPELKEGIKIDS